MDVDLSCNWSEKPAEQDPLLMALKEHAMMPLDVSCRGQDINLWPALGPIEERIGDLQPAQHMEYEDADLEMLQSSLIPESLLPMPDIYSVQLPSLKFADMYPFSDSKSAAMYDSTPCSGQSESSAALPPIQHAQNTKVMSSTSHDSRPRRCKRIHSFAEDSAADSADEREQRPAGKRKIGRPIEYRGDPDAPHLTDEQKRKYKRRTANRESACRMRIKKSEEIQYLQAQLKHSEDHQQAMHSHVRAVQEQYTELARELQITQGKLQAAQQRS